MTESVRFRQVLAGVVGVLLVAALIAVPVVGDDETTSDVRAARGDGGWVGVAPNASAPSTTVPEAGAGDGGDAGNAAPADPGAAGAGAGTASPAPAPTPTPAPTAAPTTTSAPAPTSSTAPPEDLGNPEDPGPARPPRPGNYRSKATTGSESRDTTTTIEDRGTSGGETRQLVKQRGEGFDIDSDVAWRADGVHVLSSVIMFGESKGSCDWQPDTVQLRLPAAKGTTWESASTCSMTGIGPTPIPVSRKITGKFVELRRVRVAGQVVDVWAIEGTERIEAAGRVTDRAGTTLFSPKHGFAVSSSGTLTSSEGTVEYRTEAQNLDPE